MPVTINVDIERQVESVEVFSTGAGSDGSDISMASQLAKNDAESGKLCKFLDELVSSVNNYYQQLVNEHSKAVATLSVEIASKILAKKIDEGDYEIEKIVEQILLNAPVKRDLKIKVNPGDHEKLNSLMQEKQGLFRGVEFVSDNNIRPAECILESPKGVVNSLIDEQLDKICKALQRAE